MQVIDEALYFGDHLLKESLLYPNQLRAAGNLVQDAPIQFDGFNSFDSYPWKAQVAIADAWYYIPFTNSQAYQGRGQMVSEWPLTGS